MQLKRRIRFVDCVEKVLWPIERVKSGLRSFMLEISRGMMLHGGVHQFKLIAIPLRHELRTITLTWKDSRHTENIQINKVIGENEKRVFYFTDKKHTDFLANPIKSQELTVHGCNSFPLWLLSTRGHAFRFFPCSTCTPTSFIFSTWVKLALLSPSLQLILKIFPGWVKDPEITWNSKHPISCGSGPAWGNGLVTVPPVYKGWSNLNLGLMTGNSAESCS